MPAVDLRFSISQETTKNIEKARDRPCLPDEFASKARLGPAFFATLDFLTGLISEGWRNQTDMRFAALPLGTAGRHLIG